jgi:hypothetical protein
MLKTQSHLYGLSLLLLTSAVLAAPTAVGVAERGLAAYVKEDAAAAVRGWLQSSALEGNPQAMTQANSLRQVEDFYGKAESFQIVGDHGITERSRMVYFVINFAKGPAYGRMQVFRLASGQWVSTEFKFHTEAAQVFPAHIALGTK